VKQLLLPTVSAVSGVPAVAVQTTQLGERERVINEL